MRSRSISPSTSIRSFCSDDSDSDDSDETSRYAGMTEEELNAIWERRNLAYFDRRQRLLAEGRERGDDSVGHQSSSSGSASVQRDHQQQLVRPADYICAAQDPAWRDMTSTSRNIMGEYDPERAAREPAYHNAWISCERLVNMHRSRESSGNYVPTNPRLAALMEQQRLEEAHARHEEQALQRQQALGAGTDEQQAMVDGSAPHPNPSSFSFALSATAAAQQAAAYERERFNQAHLLQQRESSADAHGSTCSLKSSSSQSSNSRDKSYSQAAEDSQHQNDSIASSSKEDFSLPSSFSPSMGDGSNNAMLVPAKEQIVSTLDDINSQHSAESVNSEQQLALRIDKETKAHHHLMRLLMRLLKEMDLGDESSDPSKGEAVASLIGDFEREVTIIQQKIQNETLLKNTAENAPLPPGWIALECPDSLDIYYVNEETGESTWDRPGLEGEANELLLNESAQSNDTSTSVQNESVGESDGDYSGSTLPPDWIALEDPDSGEMYYANEVTGVTTWERPEAETVDSNTYNEHSVSSGYDDNSRNEQTPSVRFDDTSNARSVSSQQNEEASESSFQHDAHGHESSYNTQSSDQEGSYTASYDTKSNNSSFNISGQTSAEEEEDDDDDDDDEDLPEGWYSAIDPSSNERYYCNDETGESQWERPEREEDEYEEEDESEASEELPEGWEAILDPSSGDYYYYKAEDGTTTWEKPVTDNFNQAPMQASHESNNTSQGELPENWFAIDDPVSGDTYYYNKVTNETSWEIPTDTNNLMSRLSVQDNKAERRLIVNPLFFMSSMAALAGCSHVICLKRFQSYCAMHTGNIIGFGVALAEGSMSEAKFRLSLLGSFFSGTVCARSLSSRSANKDKQHHRVVGPFALGLFVIADTIADHNKKKLALLSAAYGLVYATANQALNATITQIMTGHLTKLGAAISDCNLRNPGTVASFSILGSFTIGCALGARIFLAVDQEMPIFTIIGAIYAILLLLFQG